jgi:hypothetical protein
VAAHFAAAHPVTGQQADAGKPLQVRNLLGQSNMVGLDKATGNESSWEHAVKVKQKYLYLADEAGDWSARSDVRYVRVMDDRGGGTFGNFAGYTFATNAVPEPGLLSGLGTALVREGVSNRDRRGRQNI